MRRDWIRIENLNNFLVKGKIKQYHPDDPRHTPYWRKLKKMCIEGFWGNDFHGYRYMPGRLFFYGTFCTILDTDDKEKTRRYIKPLIRDIEWERAYMYLECEGFSGWSEDDEYTSDYRVFDKKNNDPILFKLDGTRKEFINPRENIRKIHDKPKGSPLYNNPSKNLIEMGSRGGGKSYFYSLAGAKYRMCFDGIKYYTDENRKNPPQAFVLVGSGRADKSSEFCSKIETSMNRLAIDPNMGAWGKPGDEDYQPSPFFKDMKGSLSPNNKNNPWRHEYEMKINGRWIDGFGTNSAIYHVNYSTNKRDGAEAGAGGRYNDVYYEEIGLTELVIDAYNSNRATVTLDTQFGTQVFLGTSGNMETVGPAQRIFTHPEDYECLVFDDVYEATGKIGFFLPAYMTNGIYKDKNGNTDIETAIKHYEERRDKAAQSDDPSILRVERMNYPIKPSDMWQTHKGSLLPAAEAEEREKQLMRNNLYENIGTPIQLYWDTSKTGGVDYEINHNCEPFYEFPLEREAHTRKTLDGTIMIYDFPQEIKGIVPNDMYVFTHDPYVSDEWDRGGSLGVTHVWMNPKYWDKYLKVSPLVATYIGKPKGGKKEYYKNLEKLLAFYGDPIRGLWFEANHGEYCRGYFIKQKKTSLLCLRPQRERGDKIHETVPVAYGFIVGNKLAKIPLIDDLHDLLLRDVEVMGKKLKVIETIPCIFSVRQIKMYDIVGNFDAVSSMLGYPLFIREEEHKMLNDVRRKNGRVNPLSSMTKNLLGYEQAIR